MMNRATLLFTFCLAALAACSHNPNFQSNENTSVTALGLTSPLGQDAVSQEWCTTPVTDAHGVTTLDTVQFQINAQFVRTHYEVQVETGALRVLTQSTGHWALIDTHLVLSEKGAVSNRALAVETRLSDNVKTLTINPTAATSTDGETYSACTLH